MHIVIIILFVAKPVEYVCLGWSVWYIAGHPKRGYLYNPSSIICTYIRSKGYKILMNGWIIGVRDFLAYSINGRHTYFSSLILMSYVGWLFFFLKRLFIILLSRWGWLRIEGWGWVIGLDSVRCAEWVPLKKKLFFMVNAIKNKKNIFLLLAMELRGP